MKISMGNDVMEITLDVLKKLPSGKPICIEKITNMNGDVVIAVKWTWIDMSVFPGIRTTYFDLSTGEYLREAY
jgi:hypothetical protein